MRRATAIRLVFFLGVALLFVGSLVAIGITGPIVARVPKLARELSSPPSTERLRRDVEHLLSLQSQDPTGIEEAATWIGAELEGAGLLVEPDPDADRGTVARNVVGVRPGIDPSAPVRVIAARYDRPGRSPGADESASGVAVLLEIARTLQPESPLHTQYFVAFGTDGSGSRAFAERLVARGVAVDVMVSLESVGYYDDRPGSQGFPFPFLGWLYPRRGDFAAIVGDADAGPWIRQLKLGLTGACDLPLVSLRAPRSLLWIESDDRAFRELGLPGVLVTDTGASRNPNLGRASDLPATLDYERMATLVRCFHGLLWDRDVGG